MESAREKIVYKWFQIQNIVFTAPKYLLEFFNSVLGHDDNRDVVWINKESPYLYETRWRPDFVFIKIPTKDADNFDAALRRNRIGSLTCTSDGKFQYYLEEHINKLVESPYIPDYIGKDVQMVRGPLEDFIGRVVGYSTEQRKYNIEVKLLLSTVVLPHHSNEFVLLKDKE